MRKIAIIITGISYLTSADKDNDVSNSRYVNYKDCFETYKSCVLQPLQEMYDSVDHFLVTYYNEKLNDLIQDYSPVDVKIIPKSEMASRKEWQYRYRINDSLDIVSSYMKTNNVEYSHILLTRFDLYYYRKIDFYKFYPNMLNFGWMYIEKTFIQTDDCFIFFKPCHIETIRNYTKINPYPHQLQACLKEHYGYLEQLRDKNDPSTYYTL